MWLSVPAVQNFAESPEKSQQNIWLSCSLNLDNFCPDAAFQWMTEPSVSEIIGQSAKLMNLVVLFTYKLLAIYFGDCGPGLLYARQGPCMAWDPNQEPVIVTDVPLLHVKPISIVNITNLECKYLVPLPWYFHHRETWPSNHLYRKTLHRIFENHFYQ